MRRAFLLSIAVVAVLAASTTLASATSATSSGNNFKFPPTVNAPWATGNDDGSLDSSAPTAVGVCRSSLFSTSNPYRPTANVDVINHDAVNNSGASNRGCTTPQNETTVAVNPTNPLNVAAGANDYRVCCDFIALNDGSGWAYSSKDGGATWTDVQVPGLTAQTGGEGNFKRVDAAGDPAMAFGPDGTLYYANLVFSRVSAASGLAVSISHDGGLTWSEPNMVAYDDAGNFLNDKEFIAAGQDGSVVVTWTRFNLGPHGAGYNESPIVMAISRDGGHTWNRQGSPVSDQSHPFDQGSMPLFAPDGTLYVAYEAATPESGYAQDGTIVARSTDQGQHFTQTTVGRVYDDLDCYPIYAGRQTLSGEHFRLNSYPSFSIDPTSGRLAVAWADDQGAGTCGGGGTTFTGTTSAKVKLVTSGNGITFSTPQVISGGDTVFPAVAASGGKIAVSYYTRAYAPNTPVCTAVTGNGPGVPPRFSPTPVCLDYAARSSSNGFAAETRLTTESSNPYIEFANGGFIGDYSQMAIGSNGVAHPVWTDFRGNPNAAGSKANQDVYTQTFQP